MPGCGIPEEKIQQVVDFHGHWCPGLAIGLRAGEYVNQTLGKAEDEEIVAVVETDMCAVDAIQVLTGCTFGKGNLIYRDLGKIAFSFYPRGEGKKVRLVFNRSLLSEPGDDFLELNRRWLKGTLSEEDMRRLKELRQDRARRIMEAPLEEVFEVKEPPEAAPRRARILDTMECQQCGEGVMESRTRRLAGRTLCINCFEQLDGRP
jgi:formylmethanofuran dehydrogenase subunit E